MPSTRSLFLDSLLLCLLRLFSAPIYNFYVVVENRSNNWNHIRLHHPRPNRFRATNADIDNTLESKVPFPHIHHILASACLEEADQPFDAAIDGKDISDSGGGGREVSEMVQGIDERQCRSAIKGTPIVQSSGDAHRSLIDIWDAEIDFPHRGGCSLDRDDRGLGVFAQWVRLEDRGALVVGI